MTIIYTMALSKKKLFLNLCINAIYWQASVLASKCYEKLNSTIPTLHVIALIPSFRLSLL